MLIIRDNHLSAFQPAAESLFRARLAEYLRENFADAAVQLPEGLTVLAQIPEAKLLAMIEKGLARARGYECTWESSLAAFIVLMFAAAPNFDEHPLVQRVLKNDKLPPDRRIDELWEHTSEQNWEAVKQKYDARAWQL